ncbi:MAG: ABC transporter ATP-binding protein, partial [Burkholderiales bacterium]|nr:ABC transporter ATP-binding protein [Burkholderiales bacterium]
MSVSEFVVPQTWQSNRASPARWIGSHISRHKLFIVGVLLGALGNAALAAAVPMLIGRAFDAITASPSDLNGLAIAAGLIVATQLVRGVLMLGRNFSSEIIGQRLERDIRDELYVSLLGKSM